MNKESYKPHFIMGFLWRTSFPFSEQKERVYYEETVLYTGQADKPILPDPGIVQR